jgi:Rhodopirellula transposase DDE domain
LQQLADEFGLSVTVTHLPTGASKWNPVEHQLFSQISGNWAGKPLINYETVLKFIRTTKTDTGLCVRAYLDKTDYQTGLELTAEQKAQINLFLHHALPEWSYTINPHNAV